MTGGAQGLRKASAGPLRASIGRSSQSEAGFVRPLPLLLPSGCHWNPGSSTLDYPKGPWNELEYTQFATSPPWRFNLPQTLVLVGSSCSLGGFDRGREASGCLVRVEGIVRLGEDQGPLVADLKSR